MLRRPSLTFLLGLMLAFTASSGLAQYQVTVLDSNQEGQSVNPPDPLLVNGWGIVHGPGTPWWVSDNSSGWSTLYNQNGVKQGLQVEIPPAPGGGSIGLPTGVVFNPSSNFADFQINGWQSIFMFATLDGTISGWAPGIAKFDATIAVNNSPKSASYTALAVTNKPSGNFLFAADQANNVVDIFDGTFTAKGQFEPDPAIPTGPSGFSVFGIRDIGGIVFVSFVANNGGPGGFIDKGGILLKSAFIQGGQLNQPWAFAAAPPNFGPLSNTLLIGNNSTAGTINAYNALTGQFVGKTKDLSGKAISLNQLWGLDFGDGLGANGSSNTLFFASGPDNNLAGEFGKIVFK
jgi:uncharacterized protein (TIGR03118 family)